MSTTEEIISIPAGALSEFSYEVDVLLVDGEPLYWLAEPTKGMLVIDDELVQTLPITDWERRRLMPGSPLCAAVQRYVVALRDNITTPLVSGAL